ncbi:MAG TPA: hypothetical protein DCG69_06475 [Bacteroidales bacterium]|nr:hypothetical protein [Bacteroidales bacterium]
MKSKRFSGIVLTVLGIGGLIYAAVLFVNGRNDTSDFNTLVIYGLLGLIFIFAVINLMRIGKDKA